MSNNVFPKVINIVDEKYKVVYCDDASDVCIMRRHNKLREVDFWKKEIRIYKEKSKEYEIWNRIWQSLLEIFIVKFHIDAVANDISKRELVLLEIGISSVLINNRSMNKRDSFPESIVVFNSEYDIKYYDKPSQVDGEKRRSLWGQIDYWDSIVRIYRGNFGDAGIWSTIWHELVHAILGQISSELNSNEEFVDLISIGINSILEHNEVFRNRFEN
jgi:hypothetical protein